VNPREAKARLRRDVRARRAERTDAQRAAEAERLAGHAGAVPALTVAAFVGTRTEPPTLPLLDALRAAGRPVLLPVLQPDMDLEWAPFEGAEALRPARLGLLEPASASVGRAGIEAAGLVLAPALAVDRDGRRLGQGGGSYDRALARSAAPVVAVVFDDEVLDEPIPVEAHDRRVAGALTPAAGLQWFGAPR
jgi:5-formyltetrahydrofolate cyclo-ligase